MPRLRPPPVDVPRLCRAVFGSHLKMQFWRDTHRELVRAAAGPNYSQETAVYKRPVNLLWNYQDVMLRNLVPKEPRVLLSTFSRPDKPSVSAMQSWANQEIVRCNLADKFRQWALDSLYVMGIMKVAIATPADAAASAYAQRAGGVLFERVSLGDFVWDMYARVPEEVSYAGHMLRVPLDAVKDSRVYSAARRKLEPQDWQPYYPVGDEKVRMLGIGYKGPADEYLDYVTLWEIYLPHTKRVVTLAAGADGRPDENADPLLEQEWVGPDAGPYHYLRLGEAPDNLMPVSPMMNLCDLDDAVNALYRKVIEQWRRSKRNIAVQSDLEDTINRLAKAPDGYPFKSDCPPERIKEVTTGGADPMLQQWLEQLVTKFDQMAGGLNILAARGPNSPTAAQDEMLQQNASAGVSDKQLTMTVGVSQVLKAACWFWWHNPRLVMRTEQALPNAPELSIDRSVSPSDRHRGRWADLDVRVHPYSLQFQTPQARKAAIIDLLTKVFLPLAQLAQQQGISLDLHTVFRKLGDYSDDPDYAEILSVAEPPADAVSGGGAGGAGGAGPQPAQKRTDIVRHNVPGRTQQGDAMNRVNFLMGLNPGGNPAASGNGRPNRAYAQ